MTQSLVDEPDAPGRSEWIKPKAIERGVDATHGTADEVAVAPLIEIVGDVEGDQQLIE